jgi:hypothetical protein
VLAPVTYLALALAALWPGLFTGHDTIVGNAGDPSLSIWALQWMPFALGHHLNPLFTDYLHYPGGVNLMWNSSILFPSLVLAPITLLAGPIVAYNVLTVVSMSLSGWVAFLAVRRYTRRFLSAAVGGLLYEFSPFMYPLYLLLLGPQRPSGALQGYGFVARPTSFVIPTDLQLFSGPSAVFDSSVYIGVPLLILAVVVAIRMRRRPAVLAAAITLLCAMVLALGGRLTLHGAATRIPLPWLIPEHLPIIGSLLPVRLMVAGYLALAVIVAIFVERVLEEPIGRRAGGLAIVAVALVPLIPTLPIASAQLTIPAFFTDGAAQRLPSTGSVLMTPYGKFFPDYPPELWEAVSGMAFKSQLGIVYTPGPGGHLVGPEMDPLGQELNAVGDLGTPAPATLSAGVRATYLADMRAQDVTTVIVGPSEGAAQVTRLMTELLGRPGISTGGVTVWYGVGALTG